MKGFRLSRTKTEYLRCDFNDAMSDVGDVLLDGQLVPRKDSFRYIESIIQRDGDIGGGIRHRTQERWEKWRMATGILCDRKVPANLNGKFYKNVTRPVMLYGVECWETKTQHIRELHVTEMRMLRIV
ncbi:uncharacterized protein LOC113290519 [Papaver somniferum]|uniref:uncharacterized protein LOC113290519 n=1 Tax=Papaver somniferum TaxID=3469 RepID=UPI000E6F723F|nr:uncharacterized protein LOC113290519 [Papaver somniferum]